MLFAQGRFTSNIRFICTILKMFCNLVSCNLVSCNSVTVAKLHRLIAFETCGCWVGRASAKKRDMLSLFLHVHIFIFQKSDISHFWGLQVSRALLARQ